MQPRAAPRPAALKVRDHRPVYGSEADELCLRGVSAAADAAADRDMAAGHPASRAGYRAAASIA